MAGLKSPLITPRSVQARQEVAGREETLASARASLEALQHVAQASQATERTDAACLVGKGGEEEQGTGALLDLETARDAAAFELAGLERERTKARDRAAAAVAALKEAERNLGALATQVQQAAGALAATQGQNSALEKEVFMEQVGDSGWHLRVRALGICARE